MASASKTIVAIPSTAVCSWNEGLRRWSGEIPIGKRRKGFPLTRRTSMRSRRGVGPDNIVRVRWGAPAPIQRDRPAQAGQSRAATWLILPVVICLSQRLSHACLSINCFIL